MNYSAFVGLPSCGCLLWPWSSATYTVLLSRIFYIYIYIHIHIRVCVRVCIFYSNMGSRINNGAIEFILRAAIAVMSCKWPNMRAAPFPAGSSSSAVMEYGLNKHIWHGCCALIPAWHRWFHAILHVKKLAFVPHSPAQDVWRDTGCGGRS